MMETSFCVFVLPVGMDKGIEGKSVPPAGGEILHIDAIIARCFPLTPDQQSFLRRAMSHTASTHLLRGAMRGEEKEKDGNRERKLKKRKGMG